MKIGERIKMLRKSKKISVEKLANELGVSISTVYRYEDSSIEKIPVHIFEKLCNILGVSSGELMGTEERKETKENEDNLPQNFKTPQEAMEFMLKLPMLAAFGGYDLESMDDETIMEFATEILQQLKLVSFKYKK